MKIRKEKETTERNNNDSSRANPKATSSSLHKQWQPHGSKGGGSRGRSLRRGFDPRTSDNGLYKTSAGGAPCFLPVRSTNEKKAVNWRLACFLANEYLTCRTLLGRPWPPKDSNRHEEIHQSAPMSESLNEVEYESRKEKERLYYTLADFLRTGDVHLPGILNPSQLAAWVGLT